MTAASAAELVSKSKGRSRLGNGNTLLPSVDGRSVWSRLMRDTLRGLVVHCGGDEAVSETQKLAARRVSTLEAELIYMENAIATARAEGREPPPALVDRYGTLADRQRRISGDALGWQRGQRDVGDDHWTTLSAIAAKHRAETVAEDEAEHAEPILTIPEAG
jgi:hypothetical protein